MSEVKKEQISISLPVYNEELILEQSVNQVRNFLEKNYHGEWELIIADNKSIDKTGLIGQELAAKDPRIKYIRIDEKGVGIALTTAWKISSYEVCCYTDVDLPFPLENLLALSANIIDGADLAIGSRYIQKGSYKTSISRKSLSRVYYYWMKFLFQDKYRDHCGIKAIKKSVFDELSREIHHKGWFFGTELIIKAQLRGFKVVEFPVQAINNKTRISKVNILETIEKYLIYSIKLRFEI